MCRAFLLLLALCCTQCGCTMLEWVAPHQLWKLNRQPAMGGEDGMFSIPAESPPPSKNSE